MDLKEYYNFPEGTKPVMVHTPTFNEDNVDLPCLSDMSYIFYYWKGTKAPPLNTSDVTILTGCLSYSKKLNDIDGLAYWNTFNVTNMSYLFSNSDLLNYLDPIENWYTSNVTNMSNMFNGCNKLTSIKPIENWNVSKVTDMNSMFYGCSGLTSVDLSNWNTSKVTTMSGMLNGCKNLQSFSSIDCGGLTIKNTQPIYMVTGNYEYLTDVGGFLNMKMSCDHTYGLAKCPNLTYESCINILNGLYDFTSAGETPNSNQGKLKVHSNFLTTVGDDIAIGTSKGWTINS